MPPAAAKARAVASGGRGRSSKRERFGDLSSSDDDKEEASGSETDEPPASGKRRTALSKPAAKAAKQSKARASTPERF
jgi:hypothetical protein